MRTLVFGDSIAWGAWDTEGGWVARLRKSFDSKMIISRYETYHPIYNLSVSGNTTRDILDRFDADVRTRHTEGDACLVFAVGVNDSQFSIETGKALVSPEGFKQNLLYLIEKARNITDRIVFLGLLPVQDEKLNPIPWALSHAYAMESILQYESILREVVEEKNVHFISLLGTFLKQEYAKFLADGIHPNSDGHALIAELVQDKLEKLGWFTFEC